MKKATNEMRSEKRSEKNSARRKLIPAIGMLTVSAMMLSSSTYAWFTMNKEVEVTGMELKTKVGANLLICSDNVEANYSSLDLVEGRKGLLEPVSSINGTTGSFWYTVNANARGQKESAATITQYNEDTAVANAVAGKNKYDKEFNGTYGVKATTEEFTTSNISMADAVAGDPGTPARDGAAYGYIDYVFYLKGTGDADNQELRMTECNLLYNGAAITSPAFGSGTAEAGANIDRAWRVGVFAQNITTDGGSGYDAVKTVDPAASANVSTNQKGILALSGATYFTPTQAQASASALGDVVGFKNGGDGTTGVILDGDIDRGETAYYKVLVRVWLEGEDDTCNSATYAALQDNKWALNCKFELAQGTAVTCIGTDEAKVADTQNGTQEATNNKDVEPAGG